MPQISFCIWSLVKGEGGVWVRLCYVWLGECVQVRSCLALSECPCLGDISEFPCLNENMENCMSVAGCQQVLYQDPEENTSAGVQTS